MDYEIHKIKCDDQSRDFHLEIFQFRDISFKISDYNRSSNTSSNQNILQYKPGDTLTLRPGSQKPIDY